MANLSKIKRDNIADFEKEWKNGDVSDDWSEYYAWAIWENENNPVITFE